MTEEEMYIDTFGQYGPPEDITWEWVEVNQYRLGLFRWRGHINWKDVVERAIGGSFAGLFAGGIFWALTRLVG